MAATKKNQSNILAVARKNFGFESLRPGQEEAIRSVLAGHDTLVVQPTGSGKSAIYQVAGCMREAIADREGPVEPEEISEQANLSKRKLSSAIHRLEDVGALDVLPTGEVEISEGANLGEAAEEAAEEQERHRDMRRERLRQIQEYAETGTCRREHLLRYFGDDFTEPCNRDNCEEDADGIQVDPSAGTRRKVA